MLMRPIVASGVVIEDLDADLCLYRAEVDEALVLNETAADIWRLADGRVSVDEITNQLAAAYQTSVEAIGPDVVAAVSELADRGYLVEAAPAPDSTPPAMSGAPTD
jgi:hypothetical protein